jgi:hypothetical protein
MSVSEKLKNLVNEYNAEQSTVEWKAENKPENKGYRLFSKENQKKITDKLLNDTRIEFKNKLPGFMETVKTEKKNTIGKIQAGKYQNLTSKDDTKRLIGEQQLTQALIFNSTPKSLDEKTGAIKEALSMGRNEFALSLIVPILNIKPEDIKEPEQRILREQVKTIFDNSEIKKNLEPIEKELSEIELTERAGKDFEEQLNTGKDAIVLADLWGVMDNKERGKALPLLNVTQQVQIQKKFPNG